MSAEVSMLSIHGALPRRGPSRKRKGVRRPTQVPKEPPPLPLNSAPTAIFRTGNISTSPVLLRAPGKTQLPHSFHSSQNAEGIYRQASRLDNLSPAVSRATSHYFHYSPKR